MLGDARLAQLGEAISDGTPIDWEKVGSSESDAERGVLRELRVVANIVQLHRELPMLPGASRPDPIAESGMATGQWEEHWGHLRLLDKIGHGSFGDVYRAWDTRLDREVALKLLRQPQLRSATATTVIEEGRMLARVRHPNVVTVFGAERIDGRIGVWMEFIQGRTLEQVVRERGVFSAREAMLIASDLCRALSAVHKAGLLHRDLKAQNVMREDGGRVVLMDFGTGREQAQAGPEPVRDFAGTPLYLAPEVLHGKPATAQSDVYSLGVLLFRIVTGEYPVRGRTLREVSAAHDRGGHVAITDLRPDLPDAFLQVLSRALATDPQSRFETAGAMEQALSRALAQESPKLEAVEVTPPAEATPASAPAPPGRRVGRWGLVAAALLGIIGVTAALVATGRLNPLAWFGGPALPRVAVLPIVNISGDPGQDVVADGVTELLIASLGSVRSIRVSSATSSRLYKDSKKPIPDIARELGVDHLVEGTLHRSGDKILLSVAVVDVDRNERLVPNTWERTILDVLTFQGEIARVIASHIAVTLTPEEQQSLEPTRTPANAAAQDAYLRGKFAFSGTPGTERTEAAVGFFEEAVRHDPGYALAHADLAEAYVRLANWSTRMPRADVVARAKASALKAMELQPALAGAYVALARAQFYFDWDWAAAGASLQRALQLNPSHAEAHHHYAYYLVAQGRFDEALAEARRARDLDPLIPMRTTSVGAIFFYARRYPDAIEEYNLALSLDPSFATAHYVLGRAHAAEGEFDLAIAAFDRALASGREVYMVADLARVYAEAGRPADARRLLGEVEARKASSRVSADQFAYVHIALGEIDLAFALLEQAVVEKASGPLWWKVDPRVDRVRTDPRFATLLRRVGLQP